jgi:hypothetical protein
MPECINPNAPTRFDTRSEYDDIDRFDPSLIEQDVSTSNLTSTVTLVPTTSNQHTGSEVSISPSTGATINDLGSGEIEITFVHPANECDVLEFTIGFTGTYTTTLTVKIRKTRIQLG